MIDGGLAISAAGICKVFARDASPWTRLQRSILPVEHVDDFHALQDIDVDIRPGESVGVIGRNGAGKSTLLQILSGISQPTRGHVRINGRVGTMLELGAGFDPNFTGLENVRLCAASYGLSSHQVNERMDAIEAFADIGMYYRRPVREYSSGMMARVAFAVCAHVDADILIVDEILGVGDAGFQRKCRRFMEDFVSRGGAILFVSHDPGALTTFCERAVWLDHGHKVAEGPVDEVVNGYLSSLYAVPDEPAKDDRSPPTVATSPRRWGEDPFWSGSNHMKVSPFNRQSPTHGFGGCRIEDCFVSVDGSTPAQDIQGGQRVTLHVCGIAEKPIDSAIIGFIFRDADGRNLFGDNTYNAHRHRPVQIPKGSRFEVRLGFVMPHLPDGHYSFAPSVIEGSQHDHVHLQWLEDAIAIVVEGSPVRGGKIGLVVDEISFF